MAKSFPKKALWRHFYNLAIVSVSIVNAIACVQYFLDDTPSSSKFRNFWMGYKLFLVVRSHSPIPCPIPTRPRSALCQATRTP